MNKETARIYFDMHINLIDTLQKHMKDEEFGQLRLLGNRVTYCTEDKGEMATFCLIGIGLGLRVEYLIANTFFSPISVSYKDLYKIVHNGNNVHISGNSFSIDFEVPIQK